MTNSSDLGFENKLFLAADKLRGNMDASDYKHVVLGLIFLKYISDSFDVVYENLLKDDLSDPEDKDEYLAQNSFYVPALARWNVLRDNAKQPNIGVTIDEAMIAVEKENEKSLKGVLPKNYAREEINKQKLGELIDLISTIGMRESDSSRDILGRVYEYFIGGFAGAEGKGGGEFYTPRSVVQVLVEILQPYKGRVYDPCCGSGGMFVQSQKFIEAHGGRLSDIAIYGQEMNNTTWRLAQMNMTLRGIDADIRWNNEGSFHNDELPDLKADYIIANPPFNISDWGGEHLREDARWKYGVPPEGNANFGWVQHMIHHLSPNGRAGIVLSNGSMSSSLKEEKEIKKNLIESDLVDCMVALPDKLFYSTQIPACLWFISRNKDENRKGNVLFIDARNLGKLVDRSRRELSDEDIIKISNTYHSWIKESYEDEVGFSKSATIDEVEKNDFVLTPGRYVGVKDEEHDEVTFKDKMQKFSFELEKLKSESNEFDLKIKNILKLIKYD